ncbi:MAG TPA: polyprenol monophosphomannose synthase [Gaiellaceae bacterium]|nr:polyprenol monophosphomannose synthase [Gaiellaceae bacterium]
MRLVLCLPTYNEIQNLEPMVRALGEIFAREALDGRVLVIDDASPDRTGELADRLATELQYVDVLHRKAKQGLGPAYIAGFRRALAEGAELIMEMDCDFSHAPDDVPRLVREASRADLVIGSRYVRGGRVENWGAGRRLVSRAGSVYARLVLGIDVRDLTGGFKCFRRVVLETIDLDSVSSLGYTFQVETTYRALLAGFRVEEVPIAFSDREVGGSKMTKRIVAEAVWRIPALRFAAMRGRL